MHTVKIILGLEVYLFSFRKEVIYLWNPTSKNMDILLVNQNLESWLQFLRKYKELGAEVINVFDRTIIEYSTLDALIRHERLKSMASDYKKECPKLDNV